MGYFPAKRKLKLAHDGAVNALSRLISGAICYIDWEATKAESGAGETRKVSDVYLTQGSHNNRKNIVNRRPLICVVRGNGSYDKMQMLEARAQSPKYIDLQVEHDSKRPLNIATERRNN